MTRRQNEPGTDRLRLVAKYQGLWGPPVKIFLSRKPSYSLWIMAGRAATDQSLHKKTPRSFGGKSGVFSDGLDGSWIRRHFCFRTENVSQRGRFSKYSLTLGSSWKLPFGRCTRRHSCRPLLGRHLLGELQQRRFLCFHLRSR